MIEHSKYQIRAYREITGVRHDEHLDFLAHPYIEICHFDPFQEEEILEFYRDVEERRSQWALVFNWNDDTIIVRIMHPSDPAYVSQCPRELMLSIYEGITQGGGIQVVITVGDPENMDREPIIQTIVSPEQIYYVDDRGTAPEEARLWMMRN